MSKHHTSSSLDVNETLTELDSSFTQASNGLVPEVLPSEIYCHTLTDSSILSTDLIDLGYHTITLFGLNTPASLFEENNQINPNSCRRVGTEFVLFSK